MARSKNSPLGSVVRGVAAGAIGTAVMTAGQMAYYKVTGAQGSQTPAEVGKRISEGVLHRPVPEEKMKSLNNAMHWSYGTSWGIAYGLAAGSRRPAGDGNIAGGLAFGTVVWGASLVHLPAMGLSPPVWKMPPSSIAPDLGFHLLYGAAVGCAYAALS
ncbi:MAG: DUF1440 domain-containing protein [Actinomycetota bacterium]|nr:DUF1440 domain-containing protein [Actinomycetota bacterium]